MTDLVLILVVVLLVGAALLGAVLLRSRRSSHGIASGKRLLVPFTEGDLDSRVLDAAIRIARAEEATLVPAYLLLTPLEFGLDFPMQRQVAVAMPLLEAVEHAALRAGVSVDARIEAGRTSTHALQRLWDVERFDRIIAPAPPGRGPGFTLKELAWILANAPCETLILRPEPSGAKDESPVHGIPTVGT